MTEPFTLTKADKESALWERLQKHFNERLDTSRRKNDTNLLDIETAKLRGRIAEIKYFLSLAKDRPDPDTD